MTDIGCVAVGLVDVVGGEYVRVGIEAGPLSQWLVNGPTEAGVPVICVETRHMKALLQAQEKRTLALGRHCLLEAP